VLGLLMVVQAVLQTVLGLLQSHVPGTGRREDGLERCEIQWWLLSIALLLLVLGLMGLGR